MSHGPLGFPASLAPFDPELLEVPLEPELPGLAVEPAPLLGLDRPLEPDVPELPPDPDAPSEPELPPEPDSPSEGEPPDDPLDPDAEPSSAPGPASAAFSLEPHAQRIVHDVHRARRVQDRILPAQCVWRKFTSHVMAGRIVPLLVMSPVFVCQVAPSMYPQSVMPFTLASFQNIVNWLCITCACMVSSARLMSYSVM